MSWRASSSREIMHAHTKLRRDSQFEFLNLNDNARLRKELSTGTLSVAGDAMFEEIEARIGAWTGAGRHAHEVDLMLTFSQSDGPNARTGDYLRYNPRIDDLHVDTSGDYLNCATVLIFLSDGPADGGTVFPCLRSVDRARSEQGADDAMAATCRAAGEELLAQPSFDPSVPKRDSVRFTKWGRERQTGKPLSPALRSVWDAATSACDGDGSAPGSFPRRAWRCCGSTEIAIARHGPQTSQRATSAAATTGPFTHDACMRPACAPRSKSSRGRACRRSSSTRAERNKRSQTNTKGPVSGEAEPCRDAGSNYEPRALIRACRLALHRSVPDAYVYQTGPETYDITRMHVYKQSWCRVAVTGPSPCLQRLPPRRSGQQYVLVRGRVIHVVSAGAVLGLRIARVDFSLSILLGFAG